jgi:hypothetical protein
MSLVFLSLLGGPALAAPQLAESEQAVIVEGETYRLAFSKEVGTLEIFVRNRAGEFVAVRREGGESPWYGYNDATGEYRTSQHRPEIVRRDAGDVPALDVTCPVDPQAGTLHRARYLFFDRFVIGRSQLVADSIPPGSGILRIAPRFDADITAFPGYALRGAPPGPPEVEGEMGLLRVGAWSDLGERETYVGVRPWGTRGVQVAALDPTRPYLALHNPQTGAQVAFAYPRYEEFWSGLHLFVQLYTGGYNYWYTGFGDADLFGGEFPFCLCADNTGDLAALEATVTEAIATAQDLIDREVLPIQAITARKKAAALLEELRPQVEEAWKRLEEQPRDAVLTRRLWLSRQWWREAEAHLRASVGNGRRAVPYRASEALARQSVAVAGGRE